MPTPGKGPSQTQSPRSQAQPRRNGTPDAARHGASASPAANAKPDSSDIANALRHEVEYTDISVLAITRRLLAEGVGTFALTFVAAGAVVIGTLFPGKVSFAAQVVAPGLLVMVVIYSLGTISGAHVNPFVTLAFALRADFPWRRVWGYWIVQFAGAILAALLLRLLFGNVGQLGSTLPKGGIWQSLVMEIILTFFLVTVILATATNTQIVGHNAALAVGATIALDGLFAGPISGASMNPARSLGPMLVAGQFAPMWIYVAGPLIGALLAVGFAWILRGPTTPQARKAASGDDV